MILLLLVDWPPLALSSNLEHQVSGVRPGPSVLASTWLNRRFISRLSAGARNDEDVRQTNKACAPKAQNNGQCPATCCPRSWPLSLSLSLSLSLCSLLCSLSASAAARPTCAHCLSAVSAHHSRSDAGQQAAPLRGDHRNKVRELSPPDSAAPQPRRLMIIRMAFQKKPAQSATCWARNKEVGINYRA